MPDEAPKGRMPSWLSVDPVLPGSIREGSREFATSSVPFEKLCGHRAGTSAASRLIDGWQKAE